MKLTTISRLSFFALASCFQAGAATVLSFDPDVNTVQVGDTFSVNVNLSSDNPNIQGFDMALTFPTFLTAVSVTEEGFFAAGNGVFFSPNIDNSNGLISFLADASSTGADNLTNPGPDTLFSVLFQANNVGSGTLSLVCDDGGSGTDCTDFPMLSDASFNAIPVDSAGSATITAETPEPSMIAPFLVCGILFAGSPVLRRRRW